MMIKEQLLKQITWDEYGMGNCDLLMPLFDKKIPFVFFPEENPNSITDKMMVCVNEMLALKPDNLDKIKELLYEECIFSFTVADYGCEPKKGESSLDAHLREFEISNKEDAYKKSTVIEIHIAEDNDQFNGRYAEIQIDSVSDNLINIIVKNGNIVDYDDDGTYLGAFEDDEQFAKHQRANVLKS